jgi:sulfotransferase
MTTDKTIYFLAGLPRSGSTLLANILAQNPRFHVTPTSGIIDMLVNVRNHWDQNDAFRAMERRKSETVKERVLRAMLQAYFADVPQPVCLDKNRYWSEFLEMAAVLVGARERVKVLVTVRDLRDVLASFELLYRRTSGLGQLPQEAGMALKFKTALGRVEVFADDAQPVGRAYNAIRDAVTRGWRDRMCFIAHLRFPRRGARRPRFRTRGAGHRRGRLRLRLQGPPRHPTEGRAAAAAVAEGLRRCRVPESGLAEHRGRRAVLEALHPRPRLSDCGGHYAPADRASDYACG